MWKHLQIYFIYKKTIYVLLFFNNKNIIKTQHVNLSKSYLKPLCGMSVTCQLCGHATCATDIGLKSIMQAVHDAV